MEQHIPQFQMTFTLGNLIVWFTIVAFAWRFAKWAGIIKVLLLEHEMMWRDYRERKNINGNEIEDQKALISALTYKAKVAKASGR